MTYILDSIKYYAELVVAPLTRVSGIHHLFLEVVSETWIFRILKLYMSKNTYASSFIFILGLIFFGVFFYRWNDGYENIFSIPHRFQLKLRERLFGELHGVAKEDLYSPKSRGMSRSGSSELPSSPAHTISESIGSFGEDGNHLDKEPGKVLDRSDELHLITGSNEDDGVTLQRPQRMHFIEAERIRQQREEAILRAVDIAEEQLKLKNGRQSEVQSTLGDEKKPGGSRWKFW